MAALRSISTKIFGIAVGMVLVMLVVAWWSASSIDAVNRQLRTLGQSLIPLSLEIHDLRHAFAVEKSTLVAQLAISSASATCRDALNHDATLAAAQFAAARSDIAVGKRLAFTERGRIELARLGPMLDAVGRHHDRQLGSAVRLCATPTDAEARADNAADALALDEVINALSDEIKRFTLDTATIVEDRETGAIRANFVLIAVASIVSLGLAYLVTRGLTRPIARLRAGTLAVEAGHLDRDVRVTTRDEIGDVTRTFNEMLAGLRAKEAIKATFGQYIDPRVVAQLIAAEANSAQEGAKEVATLFFSDIAGFTALSETLSPALLVAVINDYFTTMSTPIRAHDGIIDKYIGDSIMAFWVPPFVDPANQALLACQAALAQRDLLPGFNARLPDLLGLRRGVPQIGARMAVATGEVVVGSIGPGFARSFTVMGDTVNLASRLEGINKVYSTQIIVDAATVAGAGAAITTRRLDVVQVVGRDAPQEIHELVGLAGSVTPAQREVFDVYAAALDRYRVGDWTVASAGFAEALRIAPGDGPSAALLARINGLGGEPPKGWTGVWRQASK